MSRRHAIARTMTAAAIAVVGLGIGTGVAHAKEFGSEPSATAARECETIPNSPIVGDSWNYKIANAANAPQDALFTVTVDNFPPQDYTIAPGASHEGGFGTKDGLSSHITIVADGQTLVDTTTTKQCNFPQAKITFGCDGGVNSDLPSVWMEVVNWSAKPANWVGHAPGGKTFSPPPTGLSGARYMVTEDASWDASITLDGQVVADEHGFANCFADPVPSTTSTTVAPTTTVAPAQEPEPTTSTTVLAVTASTPTLPMTGGSSLPLGVAGGLLLATGAALLAGRRRAER
jgi:LPXTG-motif cell wall-anchored protein